MFPNFYFIIIHLLDLLSEGKISVECQCSARKTSNCVPTIHKIRVLHV